MSTFSMKRSICASGSGYVPSDSIGFCVAITRNGDGTGCVSCADRDLALLHDLEQRGLHLGGRAVDLVGEEEVAEDRAELGVERPLLRAVDARADEVRRDEVGRELDAGERAAEDARGRLDGQGLGEPGHALDEQVALREQAHEHALEHRVLPGDDPADLEERLLELFLRLLRRRAGLFALSVMRRPFSRGSEAHTKARVLEVWGKRSVKRDPDALRALDAHRDRARVRGAGLRELQRRALAAVAVDAVAGVAGIPSGRWLYGLRP